MIKFYNDVFLPIAAGTFLLYCAGCTIYVTWTWLAGVTNL